MELGAVGEIDVFDLVGTARARVDVPVATGRTGPVTDNRSASVVVSVRLDLEYLQKNVTKMTHHSIITTTVSDEHYNY